MFLAFFNLLICRRPSLLPSVLIFYNKVFRYILVFSINSIATHLSRLYQVTRQLSCNPNNSLTDYLAFLSTYFAEPQSQLVQPRYSVFLDSDPSWGGKPLLQTAQTWHEWKPLLAIATRMTWHCWARLYSLHLQHPQSSIKNADEFWLHKGKPTSIFQLVDSWKRT